MKVVMGDSSRIGRPPTHRLADGQSALEVARQNGIPANTARSRLQRGWTIEEATGLAPPPRRGGRPAGVVLSDGRTALVVARENGVTKAVSTGGSDAAGPRNRPPVCCHLPATAGARNC